MNNFLKKKTSAKILILILVIPIISSGCVSSTYFYRGYTPSIGPSTNKKQVRTYHGKMFESRIIGGAVSEITLDFLNPKRIISIGTDSGTAYLISIGPGLLVPLPLIPWPSGIWRAIRNKDSNNIKPGPFFYFHFGNFRPGDTLDLSKAKITTNLDQLPQFHWEVDTSHGWNDNQKLVFDSAKPAIPIKITNYIRVCLCFNEISPELKVISIDLEGALTEEQPLNIPIITFSKGKGLRLWWIPSFNG